MTGTLSAISTARQAVPAALVAWRLANRVLGPRWAKVALVGIGIGAAYALTNRRRPATGQSRATDQVRDTEDRLDDELSDSFPASDPLTVTRASAL